MTKTITKSEYLEYTLQSNSGGEYWKPKLLKCPACDEPFKAGEHRVSHIKNHTPTDFGLSPLEK